MDSGPAPRHVVFGFMNVKLVWSVIRGAVSDFFEDNVLRLSAALAYYTVFSLAPLLIIVIGVAGFVFGAEAVRGEVEHQLSGFIGANGAKAVQSMLAARQESASALAALIGVVVLIFGATGVFGELQSALNTIWEVKPKPGRGVWGFLQDRFLSFTMVLGIAFLLLVSMVISSLLHAFSGYIGSFSSASPILIQSLNYGVSFLVTALLFAMMFKLLPDANVQWKDVWIGAGVTAFLFSLGKFAISYYLGKESTTSAFGAAGSLVVILLWAYYSSIILFFGAEFTQAYACKTGTRIVPTENAMPMLTSEREQQGMTPTKRPEERVSNEPSIPSPALPAEASAKTQSHEGPRRKVVKLHPASLAVIAIVGWIVQRRLAALPHQVVRKLVHPKRG